MTYTGRIVHPLAITPDDIDIRDISHALAMKCRYTGHCKKFYSVAQHSVLMAQWDEMPGPAAWRLMHDASESYLPDIASPIKDLFPIIKEAEATILQAIATKFYLPPYETVYSEVHQADTWLMVWEGRNNMADYAPHHLVDNGDDVAPTPVGKTIIEVKPSWRRLDAPVHVLDHEFYSWSPEYAERMFLKEAKCQLDL